MSEGKLNWAYFPLTKKPNEFIYKLIALFESNMSNINSEKHEKQNSDTVLQKLRAPLENLQFEVEKSKKEKIPIPVLFGINGKVEKRFEADCYHFDQKFILEIEAGRAVINYQFLKDLFQACMMQDVKYLGIAVRNIYRRKKDFESVFTFFDTLYKSNRLSLPLEGILILGY